MLRDSGFQKGLLVVQILAIILFGLVSVPFVMDMFKWEKLDQLGIWLIQIFFLILTIIFVVLGVRLLLIKNNPFRLFHFTLSLMVLGTFLFEVSYCILRMSSIAK